MKLRITTVCAMAISQSKFLRDNYYPLIIQNRKNGGYKLGSLRTELHIGVFIAENEIVIII